MIIYPAFFRIQPTEVKKTELDSSLLQIKKNIIFNYISVGILFSLGLLAVQLILVPYVVGNTYAGTGFAPPVFSTMISFIGVLSNILLILFVLSTKQHLNLTEITKLKKSNTRTVRIPIYAIVDKTLLSIYSFNAAITILAFIFAVFLPLLLHPNFPNL